MAELEGVVPGGPIGGVSAVVIEDTAPVVQASQLSHRGYGLKDQWLMNFLNHHKLMSLSCLIDNKSVRSHYGSSMPVRMIGVNVLRTLESRLAHGRAYDYGPTGLVVGRPVSGIGSAEYVWRLVALSTIGGVRRASSSGRAAVCGC